MKKTIKFLAIASSFAFLANVANADTFIRMGSGPSGGSWYPLGAKIMQTFQAKIKGTATSNTSGGGISNDNSQSSMGNNEEGSQISNDMDDEIPF